MFSLKQQTTVEEIISSKLLEKAIVEKNGKIIIVAVFERSEYYRFFFKFEANSKRSPRKAWRYLKGQYFIMNAGPKNHTLKSFMESTYAGCEFNIRRQYKKKYIDTFYDRIANPTKYSSPVIPAGSTFDLANRLSTGKASSKYQKTYSTPRPRYENS